MEPSVLLTSKGNVKTTSASYQNAEGQLVVVIPRDHSVGEQCKFARVFPKELEGKIDPQLLLSVIEEINATLADAESINRHHVFESILAFFTCYMSYLFISTYYQRCLARLKDLLEQKNEQIFRPAGLSIRDPAELALQQIEIVVLQ